MQPRKRPHRNPMQGRVCRKQSDWQTPVDAARWQLYVSVYIRPVIGVPVAYAAGYTIFITPTACHCPMTAAARVFCPSSSDPSGPNLTPPPLMLSPMGTSTPRAAVRIVSALIEPESFGSTALKNVHPPTNPATAGMSIGAPPLSLAYMLCAFAINVWPTGDNAAMLIAASGLSAA